MQSKVSILTAALLLNGAASHAQESVAGAGSIDAVGSASVRSISNEAPASDSQAINVTSTDALESIKVSQSGVSTPSRAPVEKRSGNRLIEEIVVTAQKREEALMDVPVAITAFSAEQLDAKGIQDPKALQLSVPGLQWNVFGSYSLIYLRGVGSRAFIPSAAPSVAPYVDGIYYPFGLNLATGLGELERIEVLKGPQGTLFGRDSPAGAISIVTKEPDQIFSGSLNTSFGSYDKFNLRAYLNIPLTDELAASFAALRYREDSYYKLASDSPRSYIPKEESDGFQVRVKWTPFEDFSALLSYSYLYTASGITSMLPAHDPKPLGFLAGVRESPDYVTSENAPVFVETQVMVPSADLKYSADWFDTRLILASEDIGPPEKKIPPGAPHEIDFDGSNIPLITFVAPRSFADVQTAELQFLSNDSSPSWMKWIGGFYYLQSRVGYDPALFTVGEGAVTAISALPINPFGDFLTQARGILPSQLDYLLDHTVSLLLRGVMDTKSASVFAQGTFDFTDWMSMTLGGRFTEEERKLVKADTNVVTNPNDPLDGYVLLLNLLPQDPKTTFRKFSPKAGLDFHVTDDDLVYVSYSQGFKSGTYNIVNVYKVPSYVKPETTTTYELGYKGVLLNGALRFTGAIFRNDIKNLQEQVISLLSSGAARFENAGKARIQGAEFEFTWQVLPETLPGLALMASASYLDGEYLSYPNGSGYDQQDGLYRDQGFDFTGNTTVGTPKWSASIGPNYAFDWGDSSFEVASDIYHNDGFFYTPQNTKGTREKSYTVVDARVSWLYQPWDVRVTAYGKNLGSAKYHYAVTELDFGTGKLLAPPDTYGMQVAWKF